MELLLFHVDVDRALLTRLRAKTLRPEDLELVADFWRDMAHGECLCAEIDPSDVPCLTCAGHLHTMPNPANDTKR